MVVDIYHDECKEDGFWHGFLFVPRQTRGALLALLHQARLNTGYFHRIHYVEVGRKAKSNHQKYVVIQAWTTIGCSALQQRKLSSHRPVVLLGFNPHKRTPPEYRSLDSLLKCRFILFRENDNHQKMFATISHLQRIETTFRIAIKGGVHKLFSATDPIQIGNVFIDGDEHYVGTYGRRLSVNRTLRRMAAESREYVSFISDPSLIAQRSDHNKIEIEQSAEDSHLLQLCDVLIGGFRFHSCIGDPSHPRYAMSLPCQELLEHEQNNGARMGNSRYRNGFSIQQAWLENEEWNFTPLERARRESPEQQSLFSRSTGV